MKCLVQCLANCSKTLKKLITTFEVLFHLYWHKFWTQITQRCYCLFSGCEWKVIWAALPAYAVIKEGREWRNVNTRPPDSYLEQDTQRALVPNCSHHWVGQPCASAQGKPNLFDTRQLLSPEPFLSSRGWAICSSDGTLLRGRNGRIRSEIYRKRSFFAVSLKYHIMSHREIGSHSDQGPEPPDCSLPL